MHESSVGGPLLWPAGEPWASCSQEHDAPFGLTTPEEVRTLRRIRALGVWTDEDHAEVSRINAGHDPSLLPEGPHPLVPVAQLYARDVPDLPFPEGTDLLQVLWCPFIDIVDQSGSEAGRGGGRGSGGRAGARVRGHVRAGAGPLRAPPGAGPRIPGRARPGPRVGRAIRRWNEDRGSSPSTTARGIPRPRAGDRSRRRGARPRPPRMSPWAAATPCRSTRAPPIPGTRRSPSCSDVVRP